MESEDDSAIGQEETANSKAFPSRPIGLQRMHYQFMSSSESENEDYPNNKAAPVISVRMSKDMPLSTVKEE